MKKFIITVLVLLAATGGVAYYLYDRLSYQPDWYSKDMAADQYQIPVNVDALEKQIKRDLKNGKSVKIPAKSIVALVADQLEKKTGFEVRQAIKASRTTINPSGVELEMIVDMHRMPLENIPDDARKALDQLLKIMPESALNDLYVKFNLQLLKQEDAVALDPLSSISLGKMNLPVEKLKKKIGSKRDLSLQTFPASNFELNENAIILKP
ncbi:MAG: hypothetical protein KKH68_10900 [Proteobacteria bacterium]|nr:hypothetical protein [Pseudomonadota bacterium]